MNEWKKTRKKRVKRNKKPKMKNSSLRWSTAEIARYLSSRDTITTTTTVFFYRMQLKQQIENYIWWMCITIMQSNASQFKNSGYYQNYRFWLQHFRYQIEINNTLCYARSFSFIWFLTHGETDTLQSKTCFDSESYDSIKEFMACIR